MIRLQNFTAALLKRDGRYLLIERSRAKKIAPGVWCGVGGHMEPDELNDPLSTCLREIQEETGISQEHIRNLELRYIIIRRAKDTLRQSYIYFGDTDVTDVIDTDEGKLHWIPEFELLNRTFSKTFEAMLWRHVHTPDTQGRVVVGVAEKGASGLHMRWSLLEDFE